ncbi:MAG TPA: M1 family metallopeptidase [Candidatus Paceibacterota bacterium]|nr:M1 family metallopeptidase [Candidatus Paceibacterota bacterium]
MQKKKPNKVRLSSDVFPSKYDIALRPDLENFTFTGIETIYLSLLKKTSTFTLHSKDIDIETANISLGKDNKIFAKKITYDQKAETVTFIFPQSFPAGKIKLTIVFQGILNDKMRGFYRSRYHIDGKEHHLATTQFEATDARRAFPCFDEPAKKAVFNVSLTIPKGHVAISNTLPVSVSEHEAGYEVVKFSPTPKMSTYLLAFIVGHFEYLEAESKSGVLVRVFTTPGKKHQAGFALECTLKTLEFYEKYFDIPYPLPTLDMIAVPDFSSLAMENWGAITFREIGLLVDEKNTSGSSKEMIATVIAHELAHQWFGNLVTMEWWTHLWLNEGFASYIPYLAIEKIFPSWNIWERFTTNTQNIALRLDALKNTHPIEVEVHHPDEIGEIFDDVSYSKGASVIAMLADYLGEEKFRDGLRYYLRKHSYKNTETVHLWQAFEKVSKKPVEKLMKNWTGKEGYPVIQVEKNKNGIQISQERFFASPISKAKAKDKTIWQVPVTYGSEKIKENILLTGKKAVIPWSEKNGWLKVDLGENGVFRTSYSPALLEELRAPVENKKLPSYDRLGIVRDLFALAEAGEISADQVLKFLNAYKNEDSYNVWVEIGRGLAQLEQILSKTKNERALNDMIISTFTPVLSRLGWDPKNGEPNTDSLLRSMVIYRLARSGHEKTIRQALSHWRAIQKGMQIHPDIRGAIYGAVASTGGRKEYEALIKMYKKETMHEEQNRIGGALGDFKDPKILADVCEFAVSEHVRTQDTPSILSGVGMNPLGRDIWLGFTQKNWKMIVSRYGEGLHALSRMIKAISASAEEKHLISMRKFFGSHDAPGAERAVEQLLERLEGNVAWLKRDNKIIEKFFRN